MFDFDDIPSFELPEEIEVEGQKITSDSVGFAIAKNLAKKRNELAKLDESVSGKVERQKWLKEHIRITREQMTKLIDDMAQEEHAINLELYDYRAKRRELEFEIQRMERLLAQALENERKAKEFIENSKKFDEVIAGLEYMRPDRSDPILAHQIEGAKLLATNKRCILGDKRGAGKTLTSIASWDMAGSKRILVVVPDDVVSNFVNEIHYWAPHRQVFQLGKLPKASRDFAISMAHKLQDFCIVINYSAWRKDKTLLDSLVSLRFDTVVWDEAHEVKNTSTSAYKGLYKIVLSENCCPKCGGECALTPTADGWDSRDVCQVCGWDAHIEKPSSFPAFARCSVKMTIPMTGTVILNKPQDLFAQLSLIDPVNFVEVNDFLGTYCKQNFYTGRWEFKSGGMDSLMKKLSGKYIARPGVKTPKQTVEIHDLEIDPQQYPDQYKIMQQISKHAMILLESGKKLPILYTIALITRKRQANVWPAGIKLTDPETGDLLFDAGEDVHESIKVDKCITNKWGIFEGLIPELTEDGSQELGANVVVFSQFKGPLKEIERRCREAGIAAVRYDGDTPQHIRRQAEIDFDRKYCDQPDYEKKWQVLLCNYRTGGVGLNFTKCTEMIILDSEWNPGKEDQAMGRIDRMGQTQETNVHKIRIGNSIDDWMDSLLSQKKDMIGGFESAAGDLQAQLLEAMRNGKVL